MVVPTNWSGIESVAASETIENRELLSIFPAITDNIISLHFARQPAYERYEPYRRESKSTVEIDRMSGRRRATVGDNRIATLIGIENIVSANSALAIRASLLPATQATKSAAWYQENLIVSPANALLT